jgi:TatA/E family protein of Tat protein translocase
MEEPGDFLRRAGCPQPAGLIIRAYNLVVFGLSGTEILVVVLVALLVFGPSKLPEIARAIKAGYRELTRVREKVDTTLSELRQEMDLNFDAPHAKPATHPAPASSSASYTIGVKTGAQTLIVPEDDDYLAPGQASRGAAQEYTTEDYLREVQP